MKTAKSLKSVIPVEGEEGVANHGVSWSTEEEATLQRFGQTQTRVLILLTNAVEALD